MTTFRMAGGILAAALGATFSLGLGAGGAAAESLTIYSGRGEQLVAPIVRQFEKETGIKVSVRYAGTSELAVLLQEEGARSPADVFWAQDAGALGAVAKRELFADLPEDVYSDLPPIFTSQSNSWVATSGRARVLAYSGERVKAEELPASITDLTNEKFNGRVGWAPTNGSFQSHVTGMRLTLGEDATRAWLEGMKAGGAKVYRNNTAVVQAIADGEVDFGLVNNYYLLNFKAKDPKFPVEQTFFKEGDIGNMVNVAGVGVLASSKNAEAGLKFTRYLLTPQAQQYFTTNVNEYPVVRSVVQNPDLEDFDRLLELSPKINLDAIEDLDATLALLRDVGLL